MLIPSVINDTLFGGHRLRYSDNYDVMRYYDRGANRLVYLHAMDRTDAEFWDEEWDNDYLAKQIGNLGEEEEFVIDWTRKYLLPGSVVLEGGCGLGNKVFALKKAGYNAVGVDFSMIAVERIKSALPQLDIRKGNVLALEFPDDYFDGYWSLGVIEHFYFGFEPLIREMRRVLKRGGCAFVTFPSMNPLRRLKGAVGAFPAYTAPENVSSRFYQFALAPNWVKDVAQREGFVLLKMRRFNGLKGIGDDVERLRSLTLRLARSRRASAKIAKSIAAVCFDKLAHHQCIGVFKKVE